MLYKGCERPHWRDKMPGFTGKKSKQLFGKTPATEQYYHQIFFHYVLQDGQRHTVHGIEHDEGTTFEYPTINIKLKTGSSRRKDYLGLRRRSL